MNTSTVELRAEAVPTPPLQVLEGATAATADLGPIWIIEEVAGHLRSKRRTDAALRLRLYRLNGDVLTTEQELELGSEARVDVALSLLQLAKARRGVLICSYRAVAVSQLVELLEFNRSELNYVVEIDPSRKVEFARSRDGIRVASPKERIEAVSWQPVSLSKPAGSSECFAANLGKASLGEVWGCPIG
jgi:hypothetical protein